MPEEVGPDKNDDRSGLGYVAGVGDTRCRGRVPPAPEHVGSWTITCPGGAPCAMRFSKRFFDKSGITGDLEIDAEGDFLVPVLAVRGLSSEVLMAAAMAGKTEASLQFAGGAPETLDCAISESGYICAPNRAAGSKLAAALPAARQVTVRVTVAVIRVCSPLPTQENRWS